MHWMHLTPASSRGDGGVLHIGAILDRSVLARGSLGLDDIVWPHLVMTFFDVTFDGETARAFGVVLREFDAGILFPFQYSVIV